MKSTQVLTACMALLIVTAEAQASVAWDNENGSAETFDWANGYNSDTNLFGSPDHYGGDNFYFTDSNFDAYADDAGTYHVVTDTLNVDLLAHAAWQFAEISWPEYGDYNITGGDDNQVSVFAEITVTVEGHPMSPFQDSFLFNVSGDSSGSGAWNDSTDVILDLTSMGLPPVTELHLTFTNTLTALSDGNGGTASISGNFVMGPSIITTPIPEPSALLLLAFGGMLTVGRPLRSSMRY